MRLKWAVTCLVLGSGIASAAADPLCDAIRNNRLAEIKQIAAGNKDLNSGRCQGHSALQYAAAVGTLDALKVLISAGADVNAKDAADMTPLMWGVTSIDKVRVMLDSGAAVDAKTKTGATALLLISGDPGTLEIMKLLVAKGADLKVKDEIENTVLLNASSSGDIAKVKYLVEQGIDVNAANKGGFTALLNAAGNGDLEMVRYLLAKGAKVNVANSFAGKVKHGPIGLMGLTPLMVAAPYGSPELLKTLLDAGADVNAKDSRGMTPLMLSVATDAQNPASVKLLLARGADASVKDKYGDSALDWARKIGNPESIRLLKGTAEKPELFRASGTAKDANTAIEKSFDLIQKSSNSFFKESGCPACHHVNTAAMTSAVLRKAGFKLDDAVALEPAKLTKGRWLRAENFLMQRRDPGGAVDQVGYGALAMAVHNMEPDVATDSMALYAAMLQLPTGAWPHGSIARAPVEDSAIHTTALGIRLIRAYGPPARQAEWDERVGRAKRWLLQAKPMNNDDRSMQLIGLKWAGAADAEMRPLVKNLLAQQRADGGWAQNGWLASDAYATGQALYALSEGGCKDTKPRQAASRFLLGTQKDDGSWHVRSRSPKFQPYFESGFPYGPDQWISNAATAWATMGLAVSRP